MNKLEIDSDIKIMVFLAIGLVVATPVICFGTAIILNYYLFDNALVFLEMDIGYGFVFIASGLFIFVTNSLMMLSGRYKI